MKKGLVHIYTGDGKGKTTASVGLAVRALAHGFKVVYASFFKRPDENGYSEVQVLKDLGASVFSFAEGMPMANKHISAEEYNSAVVKGLTDLKEFIKNHETDLLVLDEILIALKCDFLTDEELLNFIREKPKAMELVLTGRGATEKLRERADYVSNLTKEKHPFDVGVESREGIEY